MSRFLESINIDVNEKQINEIKDNVEFRNEDCNACYFTVKKEDAGTYSLTIQTNNLINAELEAILRQASVPITKEAIQNKAIYRFTPNGNVTATLFIKVEE